MILSLVVPGLGHFYLGRWLMGAAFFFGTAVIVRLLLVHMPLEEIAAGRPPAAVGPVIVYTLIMLALPVWCAWNAYRTASRR